MHKKLNFFLLSAFLLPLALLGTNRLFFSSVVLAGQESPDKDQYAPEEMGTLYIYRKHQLGGSLAAPIITLNGRKTVLLYTRKYLKMRVNAGTHYIWAVDLRATGSAHLKVAVQPGKSTFVEYQFKNAVSGNPNSESNKRLTNTTGVVDESSLTGYREVEVATFFTPRLFAYPSTPARER